MYPMSLLIERDHLAHTVVVGTAVAAVGGEVVATYLGQARDGRRRIFGSLSEALLLVPRRDGTRDDDRRTKQILVAALLAGLVSAYALAKHVPSLRALADNWWTLAIGVAVAVAGIALRSLAVWTLGRYFRREVTVESGQHVIRSGPYRWIRHPAYAGNLLTYCGLGLAFGSWVSAVILGVAVLVGTVPRIRVEEEALERELGGDYSEYKLTTSRLIPHVW